MSENQHPEAESALPHWVPMSESLSFSCKIFDIRSIRFRHPKRASEGDFVVIDAPDWVNVLALTPAFDAIIVNQFRFGIETTSWEVPGGLVEKGEDPVAAGLRELQEETGYVAESGSLLGKTRPNPAIMSNTCHFVLAKNCRQETTPDWDEHEELECKSVPIDALYAMAHRGEIDHSLTMNALFAYYPEWLKWQKRRR